MIQCALCETEVAGGRMCEFCAYQSPADELLCDPGLSSIRTDLLKAVRWLYYLEAHWRLSNLDDAKGVIGYFNARELDIIEQRVIGSITRKEVGGDPYSHAILDPVVKIIGASQDEARVYVEDLKAHGLVRIESDSGTAFGGPLTEQEEIG
jgi:hypothetical protein